MAQLLYRPEAVIGESMYGYIHRVAYYNGFKRLAALINHLTKEKRPYIPTRDLMGSRDILNALCSATHADNIEKLRLNPSAYFKAGCNGFTHSPKVCPLCFDEQPALKHRWIRYEDALCPEHGEPFIHLNWVKFNTERTIDWQELSNICKTKVCQSSASVPDSIVQFNKAYGSKVTLHIEPYFDQRISQVAASALLPPKLRSELLKFSGRSPKEKFQRVIKILAAPHYMSENRAYELTYWGIVDWLLEVDHVGLSESWPWMKSDIEYCKNQFIKDFPPSDTSRLYCDTKFPKAFLQLQLFSPAFSSPWSRLLDLHEVKELAI